MDKTTPNRRVDDKRQEGAVDWSNPDQVASLAESSTAGAAKGGITSLEGLTRYDYVPGESGRMIIGQDDNGMYVLRADVERLLAAPTEEGAEVVPVPRETLLEIYEAMNYMGDALNEVDACDDEGEEKTTPAFEAMRRLLDDSYIPPAPAKVSSAIASPAVEGKPAGLTKRRIEQIGFALRIQAFENAVFRAERGSKMTGPEKDEFNTMVDFARAIEREVLAAQQPQVDSSARDQALAEAESAVEDVMNSADASGESAEGIGAWRCLQRIRALKSSSLPTVAAGLTKEDGDA